MDHRHVVWACAFAWVGMCWAIAWGNVYSPPSPREREKSLVEKCMEMRGEWISGSFGHQSWCKVPEKKP